MARLIPSFMDDRTPPGEREVFNLLAAGPDNWIALHSLDLAPWNRGLLGPLLTLYFRVLLRRLL